MLAELSEQRINYATSEALHRYMLVLLEEMWRCFARLIPISASTYFFHRPAQKVSRRRTSTPVLREKEENALNNFLQNSYGAEQIGDALRSRTDLQNIVRELYGRWSSDLQLMNSPAEAGTNKVKLCEMTIDLYQSVLALLVDNSVGILRIILSSNDN